MKRVAISAFLTALPAGVSVFAETPLSGKVIAFDAGHGGTETGAVNASIGVMEKAADTYSAKLLKLAEKYP